MAERTKVGQDFGSVIWNADFDMLAPGRTESSITVGQSVIYRNITAKENSVDHFRTILRGQDLHLLDTTNLFTAHVDQ